MKLLLSFVMVAVLQCGLKPLELPPLVAGCQRMVQQCACDSSGNCRWVWVCVRR